MKKAVFILDLSVLALSLILFTAGLLAFDFMIALYILIPMGLTAVTVTNTLVIRGSCKKNRPFKFIFNAAVQTLLLVLFVFFLFDGSFEIATYVVIPACILSFLISFLLPFMIERSHATERGEKKPICDYAPFSLPAGLLLFNLSLTVTAVYMRFSQVVFCFGRYRKTAADCIKISLLFLLAALTVFLLVCLVLALFKRFSGSAPRICLGGAAMAAVEGAVCFVLIVTCLMGCFCFYPNGYPAEAPAGLENVKQITLKSGKNSFSGLYADYGRDKLVLFFPGNGMSAYVTVSAVHNHLKSADCNFLTVDYPYFGESHARLSQEVLFEEADEFYRYAREELGFADADITVAGFSIGTGMANYTASTHSPARLILGAPYNNFTSVINTYLNIFDSPAAAFLEFKFPSDEFAKKITCPVTVLCVADDVIVRPELALKLCESYPTYPELIRAEYGGHNSVMYNKDYLKTVFGLSDEYFESQDSEIPETDFEPETAG